jgi:hypothetical protein
LQVDSWLQLAIIALAIYINDCTKSENIRSSSL